MAEVLSVTNAETDLGKKLLAYHAAGIPHYWIVDPEHETLTVYRFSDQGYVVVLTSGRREVVRAPPFEEIEIEIAMLFGA